MPSNSFDILIAGAGIGGLTAALALAQAGHRVVLLERAALLGEAGAGVQLSPNATRVLAGLGLLESIRRIATEPERLRIRRGRDGRTLATVELGAAAERRWGSPNLVLHRADLQRLLLAELAVNPRVSLHTGTEVLAVCAHTDAVSVATRRDGAESRFKADALIGADGLRSVIRRALGRQLGEGADDAPHYSGRMAWRATIPTERLAPAFRRVESGLWLGDRAHLVHYPLRDGTALNVVAITQTPVRTATDLSWNAAGDPRIVEQRFANWCEDARTLAAAAPEWRVWPLFERPELLRWGVGRVSLMGDAAHPLLPFLAQGAAQAIEDAGALGAAFTTRGGVEVEAALRAYEKARCRRAAAVQIQSKRQGQIYHLAGPMALARDTIMQALGPQRLVARYDWIYGPVARSNNAASVNSRARSRPGSRRG